MTDNRKYIIGVNNTEFVARMEENTFLLSKNHESAMVLNGFTNAVTMLNSMRAMANDFGESTELDLIEITE